MESANQIRATETARGLLVKRNNAITATFSGLALAWLSLRFSTNSLLLLPLGLLAGVLYANAFEYILHRFLLHWGSGFLDYRHDLHHSSVGAPHEARYINFSTSPLVVVLVFLLNSPLPLAIERFFGRGLGTGMFLGFTVYFILYEEIHWRIHMNGWLPRFLLPARRHHLQHHAGAPAHFNIFLPLFDLLLPAPRNKSAR